MTENRTEQPAKPNSLAKDLESSRFNFRSFQDAVESGGGVTLSWIEDAVIRKMASIAVGKDALGNETATVRIFNPKTQKDEIIYHTDVEAEVDRFKSILKGETLVGEVSK